MNRLDRALRRPLTVAEPPVSPELQCLILTLCLTLIPGILLLFLILYSFHRHYFNRSYILPCRWIAGRRIWKPPDRRTFHAIRARLLTTTARNNHKASSLPRRDTDDFDYHAISRDKCSLSNQQPFNLLGDGPPYSCPILNCTCEKQWKSARQAYMHVQASHLDGLDAKSQDEILRQIPYNVYESWQKGWCYTCKSFRGYRNKHRHCSGSAVIPSEPEEVKEDSEPVREFPLQLTLDEVRSKFVFSRRHVSRATAPMVVNCLELIFNSALEGDWVPYYLFPRVAMQVPPRTGSSNRHRNRSTRFCLKLLSDFQERKFNELWAELPNNPVRGSRQRCNEKLAKLYAREGWAAKACRVLDSNGIAPFDDEDVFAQLAQKHPSEDEPEIPRPDWPSLKIWKETLVAALRSFHQSSAPGPSGFRPAWLKVLLRKDIDTSRAIASLVRLVNMILAGKLESSIQSTFFGANLIGLYKDESHCSVRPIAVGEVLRRLVSKCVAVQLRSRFVDLLSPYGQLGVGVKCGTEKISHLLSHCLDEIGDDESHTLLQIDFENAFNNVSRRAVVSSVATHFPELLPYIELCYGKHSRLFYGNWELVSACGVQQGDPLGPTLFSLTLLPYLQRMKKLCVQSLWYLDDGNLILPVDNVPQVLDCFAAAVDDGLSLNVSKCHSYWPTESPAHLILPSWQAHGLRCLVTPIGSHDFVQDFYNRVLDKLESLTQAIARLDDPHIEFYLLRMCTGFGRLNHLFRTVNPLQYDFIDVFQHIMRRSLERILLLGPGELDDVGFLQASLAPRSGGFGLRCHYGHVLAAYLGSLCQSTMFLRSNLAANDDWIHPAFGRVFESLTELSSSEIFESFDLKEAITSEAPIQRRLSALIDQHLAGIVMDSFDTDCDKARFYSILLPHASAWVSAPPSTAYRFYILPNHFRVLCKLWLGMTLVPANFICPDCRSPVDLRGYHLLHCMKGSNKSLRHARHDAVRDTLYTCAQSARLSFRKEVNRLLPLSQRRPGDLVTLSARASPTAYDCCIYSPLQKDLIHQAAESSGSALCRAHGFKMRQCDENGFIKGTDIKLIPLAMESFGGMHADTIDFCKHIAQNYSDHTGTEFSVAASFVYRSVSFALHKVQSAHLANMLALAWDIG